MATGLNGAMQVRIAAAASALICATFAHAQGHSRSLFNGRNLSGWHVDVPARDSNARLRNPFIVRNGMLVSLGEPRGHLITNSSYRNYRLEGEYRFQIGRASCRERV